MNIVTTRFGLVQCSEEEILHIPEGLVGFRSQTKYVLIPDQVVTGLFWLQSTTSPELAFALVAPPMAVNDYKIELRPGDRATLELDDERAALIYVILNRGDSGLTVNLQGPLVFNMTRRLGRQLVLTSSRYAVRYPVGSTSEHHAHSGSGLGSGKSDSSRLPSLNRYRSSAAVSHSLDSASVNEEEADALLAVGAGA